MSTSAPSFHNRFIFFLKFSLLFILHQSWANAETIHLKDGRVIEGKIMNKDGKCMRVDLVDGMGMMTYCVDEIKDIDGAPSILPINHIKKQTSVGLIDDPLDPILEHLGYPKHTWPGIEKQFRALLSKIDYMKLKEEFSRAKSSPSQLKKMATQLGRLLEENGYIDLLSPHPLVKLLTTSFANDDISQVIFTSPISFLQKVDSKKSLAACTAISQLGSILLKLMDIDVKVAFSPGHVFNCIRLNDQQIIFADFANQIFDIVDINHYYLNLGSKTMLLKDLYHISPSRILEINGQLTSELQSDSLEERLNALYLYIYVSDDYATTPGIFINLGNIYSQKGDYAEAFSFFNKAITLNPEYPEAYRERGITYGNKGDLADAMTDLSKAIELFPDFAEAFHDRASAYSASGDFDNAIADLNQALIINPNYVEAYHDRGKYYSNNGDVDRAIDDYNKAI